MHDPDFIVYKDSQTDVEFIVRNVDRKPINLTDKRITGTIVDYYSKKMIYRIELVVVDAARGLCRATFTPRMVRDWKLGFHQYTITWQLDNGNEKHLYLDLNDQTRGFFDVRYGRDIEGTISQSFNFSEFKPVDSNYETIYISPYFKGNLQNGSSTGLHTLAIYQENWRGDIWIEGSIVKEFPLETDWYPILVCNSYFIHIENSCDKIIANNICAQLQWLRLKVWPHESNTGKIEKILFRN